MELGGILAPNWLGSRLDPGHWIRWAPVTPQVGTKIDQKSCKDRSQTQPFFNHSLERFRSPIGDEFGWILDPTMESKSVQKGSPKRSRFWIRFWTDWGQIFGWFWSIRGWCLVNFVLIFGRHWDDTLFDFGSSFGQFRLIFCDVWVAFDVAFLLAF